MHLLLHSTWRSTRGLVLSTVTVLSSTGLHAQTSSATLDTATQTARRTQAPPTSVSWLDWVAPFQDPLNTQPHDHGPNKGALLEPPQIRWQDVQSRRGVPDLGATDFSCQPVQAMQDMDRSAPAASGPSRMLSLAQALGMALCANPQVRTSWIAIVRASADLGLSKSTYWPQATAAVTRQHSRISGLGPDGSSSNLRATSENLSISWRVFDFGARPARVRAAQAQLRATLASRDAAVREVTLDVMDSYVQAQALYAKLDRQRDILKLGETMLTSSQRRLDGGASGRNAVLQAQASQARNHLEKTKTQAELEVLQQRLRKLTGLPPLQAFGLHPIPDELTPATASESPRLASPGLSQDAVLVDWLQRARDVHPSIVAAAAKLDAASATVQVVKSDAWPRIDLAYGHYRNGRPTQTLSSNRSNERTLGLTLTIPLFEGFAPTYRIRSAQADRESAQVALDAAVTDAEQEIITAYTQARASLQLLSSAAHLFKISQEVVTSNQALLSHGVMDALEANRGLQDLQRANDELTQAQVQWLRAKLHLWLLAA